MAFYMAILYWRSLEWVGTGGFQIPAVKTVLEVQAAIAAGLPKRDQEPD
jgi:hypothetical protein